jgi:alcohol dehydrogenase
MRVHVQTGYGPTADNIALIERPEPTPGSGDVVVAVHAASLNPIDYKIVHGLMRRVRSLKFPSPMGFDGSGVITAVGKRVKKFKVGDAVFFRAPIERRGSFAESIAIDERLVAAKPDKLSHGDAASLPLVGLTTVQGVTDRAKAKAGQSILIHAGSGGVGTFAVQYAKAIGLTVTSTTSSRNVDLVRSLGADHVVAYDKEDYRSRPDRYDIVFDMLGGDTLMDAFKVVKRGGTVISIAGPPTADVARQVKAGFIVRIAMAFMRRKVMAAARAAGAQYFGYLTESSGAQLEQIAALTDAGKLRAVIDNTFPFTGLAAAYAHLETGRSRGKVNLQVRS